MWGLTGQELVRCFVKMNCSTSLQKRVDSVQVWIFVSEWLRQSLYHLLNFFTCSSGQEFIASAVLEVARKLFACLLGMIIWFRWVLCICIWRTYTRFSVLGRLFSCLCFCFPVDTAFVSSRRVFICLSVFWAQSVHLFIWAVGLKSGSSDQKDTRNTCPCAVYVPSKKEAIWSVRVCPPHPMPLQHSWLSGSLTRSQQVKTRWLSGHLSLKP